MGHLAGLIGVVTGQAGPPREAGQTPPALIDFEETFTTPAVPPGPQGDAEIIWTTTAHSSNLAVRYVRLYNGEEDAVIAESNMERDFIQSPARRDEGIDNSGSRVRRLLTYDRDDGRNMTVLPINSSPGYFSNVWNSVVLYMEFELWNDTRIGKGYSPPFRVNHNENGLNQVLREDPAPVEQDNFEVHWIATTTGVPTVTPSPTSGGPSPGAGPSTSIPAAEDSSGQNKGGLSAGAIAGIAVGIGVGLLAIAGLSVWFCLRRRQSGRPLVRAREVGYGSDSGAVAMMPEKEAAGLTESPSHPVYDPTSAPVAHHSDPTAAAASYAPYSDQVVAPGTAVTTPTATSLNEPSPVLHQQQGPGGEAGAAHQHQQQPIASRYAHLVEEGMTVEEIRRLEEEERQLDAAIEEAGHRHSQARQ